jgi:hypothetical protein
MKTNVQMFMLTAIGIMLMTPSLVFAQQQGLNFASNLTGKDMVPPVNSVATGVAKFHLNPNGGYVIS